MINPAPRLKQIKEQYVDRGSYFVINRGKQYGKTTTLQALAEYLADEYIIVHWIFVSSKIQTFETKMHLHVQ